MNVLSLLLIFSLFPIPEFPPVTLGNYVLYSYVQSSNAQNQDFAIHDDEKSECEQKIVELESQVEELEARLESIESKFNNVRNTFNYTQFALENLKIEVSDFESEDWQKTVPYVEMATLQLETSIDDLESAISNVELEF